MNEPAENPAQLLRSFASGLGFGRSGFCAAVSPTRFGAFQQWLDSGMAGEMKYLGRDPETRRHPSSILEGVRSVMMLATNYCSTDPIPLSDSASLATGGRGRVSRYAWGETDYHQLVWGRLDQLAERARELFPGCQARGVIDTAPLLEREFASLAGLGWQAKNTMLISPRHGSWFFLAALLLDVDLPADPPIEIDYCGTCTACLDACPTDAFLAPRVLDARRCISYLTIELKTQIPRPLRSAMGDWMFGCDVCQEVCPWNRFSESTEDSHFYPVADDRSGKGLEGTVDLRELFFWTEARFRERFRSTALWRPRRRGLLRNAAVVLGNQRQAESVPALSAGVCDSEPLVRGASAWALGQVGGEAAREILARRMLEESDPEVREELATSLDELETKG